jgi:hypothetical protein
MSRIESSASLVMGCRPNCYLVRLGAWHVLGNRDKVAS